MKSWAGIDNGISGAIAILREDGSFRVEHVPVCEVGKSTFIDSEALADILFQEGLPFTVFEQGQKQPKFGCKGNFANGDSFATVRTVLRLTKTPSMYVNPKQWQKDIFAGIRGTADNTKGASIEFCRRVYPHISLIPPRCRVADDNFADAICMAHWSRTKAFAQHDRGGDFI